MKRNLSRVRRRGVAMLLVLGVVAIASVLGWAMLSATTVRAKVETASADSLEAAYQADSGVSYALYYLRYPAKSPVAKQAGTYDIYYPGETGLAMWSGARGTTDVSVTNTGDGQFSIRSTATIAGLKRTTVADAIYTYDRYTVSHAMAFNGNFNVPLNMKISGPVLAKGTVSDPWGRISNSPAITAAGSNVTPISTELSLMADTLTASKKPKKLTDRMYVYDGIYYTAEEAPLTITGPLISSNDDNPLNVWYSDNNVTLNNATLVGTLVVRTGKTLVVTGLNTIAAKKPDMPALMVGGPLDMKTTAVSSRLTVAGVAWLAKDITDSAAVRSTSGWLKVTGALLMADSTPSINTRYLSQIEVTYDAAAAKIPALSTVKSSSPTGIAIRGWRTEAN